jgi:hypothetical protein
VVLAGAGRQHGSTRTIKEATVLDAYTDYKLYREEMERVVKRLELRRQLPERERRQLPHVRLSFARRRRHRRLADPIGC